MGSQNFADRITAELDDQAVTIGGAATFSGAVTASSTVALNGAVTASDVINVNGDTSDVTTGIIMSSPNATLYKLVVADNGTVTATAVV